MATDAEPWTRAHWLSAAGIFVSTCTLLLGAAGNWLPDASKAAIREQVGIVGVPMLLTAFEWLWWAAPCLFNLTALGLIQWALYIERRANAHATASDKQLAAERAEAGIKLAEIEATAAAVVQAAEARAQEAAEDAKSQAHALVMAAEARVKQAGVHVQQVEAPERLLAQAPEVAVRCRVGEVRVVGRTLFIPVWVENRLRYTSIRVERVDLQPLILTKDWSQERAVQVQQETLGAKEVGGLGELCFLYSAHLPPSTSPPPPGRVQLVHLSGVQGGCFVKGPWGEQWIQLQPVGRRLLLPEEA